jgi:RNA methyltransferase, TrmH family
MLVKQKVKYIQSLGQKKFREQEELFIAEGPKIVKELLKAIPEHIMEIYALKEWIIETRGLLNKTQIIEITEIELEKISQLTTPNKVVAVVKQFHKEANIIVKDRITLALDTIQDPGNLGTIIRIADWFGIDQVVCSNDCAEIYNPKVVQATMGSIARVKIFYTDLEQWLSDRKEVSIYATTLEGQDIREIKKIQEAIIVIGNESKGISNGILKLADTKITIPHKGKAESLNAAVAAGIILSHFA